MAHDHDDTPDDLTLQRLLHDAVDDIRPADRLGEIRRRTAPSPRRSRQRWTLAVLGAGVATASVVGAVALVGNLGLPGDDDPATAGAGQTAVAAYFVGDTPLGPRLFREFQAVTRTADAPRALAALRLLETDAGPSDPDYTTAWPDGSFTDVRVTDTVIEVDLADRHRAVPDELAAQQAVFTVQAALGSTLPVRFRTPGGPVDVAGKALSGRDNDRLAPVNVTDPVEGHTVDDLLTVRGVVSLSGPAISSVRWELRTTDGEVLASGEAAVEGGAWEQTSSIADVPAGTHVLVVSIPVTGDGPAGRATDTRTLTVR